MAAFHAIIFRQFFQERFVQVLQKSDTLGKPLDFDTDYTEHLIGMRCYKQEDL